MKKLTIIGAIIIVVALLFITFAPHDFFGEEDLSDHPLVGTWEMGAIWQYTFYEDGSGTRGLSGIGAQPDHQTNFHWIIRGDGHIRLEIIRGPGSLTLWRRWIGGTPDLREEWNYNISDHYLTLDSRQSDQTYIYRRVD